VVGTSAFRAMPSFTSWPFPMLGRSEQLHLYGLVVVGSAALACPSVAAAGLPELSDHAAAPVGHPAGAGLLGVVVLVGTALVDSLAP